MSKVLVIEDDARIRSNLVELLESEGFVVVAAADGEAGLTLAVQELPDLVICDVAMPGIDGYEVLEVLGRRSSTASIPFIFLSARADRADVRKGMTLGADDYLTKPFTRTELLDSIRARLRRRDARDEPPASSEAGEGPTGTGTGSAPRGFVVRDPAMLELFRQIERVAKSAISVLVLGETGVGKEVVAEQIHRASGRKGPFVALNCAALPEQLLESELFGHEKGAFTGAIKSQEGLFESAEGGTIFLDEAGELPLSTQAKLLRVLEDRRVMRVGGRTPRPIDVRFVSATNRDVERDIDEGSFRQDLYFRLNGITLTIPPLRERQADVGPLAEHFAAAVRRAEGRSSARVSPEAVALLERHGWPGNVRELRNVIERALLLCDGDVILPQHLANGISGLSARPSGTASLPSSDREKLLQQMETLERQRVVDALSRCGGNQTKAATELGISRRTLVSRLGAYDLPRPRKRGPA